MIITVKNTYLHIAWKKGAVTFCSRLLENGWSAKYGVYLSVVIVTNHQGYKSFTYEPKCSAFTFYTNKSIDYVNRINVRQRIRGFSSNSIGKFCHVSEENVIGFGSSKCINHFCILSKNINVIQFSSIFVWNWEF